MIEKLNFGVSVGPESSQNGEHFRKPEELPRIGNSEKKKKRYLTPGQRQTQNRVNNHSKRK